MSILDIKWSVFLIGAVIMYVLLPGRVRNTALFAASLFFLTYSDIRSLPPMLVIILITYAAGRVLAGDRASYRRTVLITGVAFIISVLALGRIMSWYGCLGLSFYSLEAIGYLCDCYHGRVKPEKNIMDLGLFLSFFCNLISGPIERADGLLAQIKNNKKRNRRELLTATGLRNGLILILWGAFLKLVIAGRLHIITETIWSDLYSQDTTALASAAISYSMEIYSDFLGYSMIAIGSAACLGYSLTDNFRAPYLAESVRGFWECWHISLSRWLRDYIYIPLGGNRKGRLRRFVNVMATFAVSGLWHGFGPQFMVWGLMHGAAVSAHGFTHSFHRKGASAEISSGGSVSLSADRGAVAGRTFGERFFMMAGTFCFVTFAWIFFRAPSLEQALVFIYRMFTQWDPWNTVFPDANMITWGLDHGEWVILAPALFLMCVFDVIAKRRKKRIDEWLSEQIMPFRVLFCLFLLIYTLVFGIYGPGFSSADFIYSQF